MNVEHAISTFRGHTVPHFRIVQNKRRWLLLSGIVILLSLAGLFLRGINYSIDFKGYFPGNVGAIDMYWYNRDQIGRYMKTAYKMSNSEQCVGGHRDRAGASDRDPAAGLAPRWPRGRQRERPRRRDRWRGGQRDGDGHDRCSSSSADRR